MSAGHRSRWALANRRTDTRGEVTLRSALHRRGLRFRKNREIRLPERSVRPDIVFARARVVVFVDGCFWHCCPEHGGQPKGNPAYWGPKLAGNVRRDRLVDAQLREAGWTVVRIWEHMLPEQAADIVAAEVSKSLSAERSREQALS